MKDNYIAELEKRMITLPKHLDKMLDGSEEIDIRVLSAIATRTDKRLVIKLVDIEEGN